MQQTYLLRAITVVWVSIDMGFDRPSSEMWPRLRRPATIWTEKPTGQSPLTATLVKRDRVLEMMAGRTRDSREVSAIYVHCTYIHT